MIEVWKDISGYEGLYQVSNMGQVKSLNYNKTGKEKLLKQEINQIKLKNRIYNSHRITLFDKDKNKKRFLVHHLVYETFVDDIPAGMIIDHINNNSDDNSLCNLQLFTYSQNNKKAFVDNPDLKNRVSEWSKKKIKCVENDIIYESISEAARCLNLDKGNISKVIKGKQKNTKGYRFILV